MSRILDKLTRTMGSEYRDLNTETIGTVTYMTESSPCRLPGASKRGGPASVTYCGLQIFIKADPLSYLINNL